MNAMYLPLRRRGRDLVREVAKASYEKHEGDEDAAIAAAKAEIRSDEFKSKLRSRTRTRVGSVITTFLISLAIKLAVELIIYWIKQEFLEVPSSYQPGEPGYA
jgi:hypothetical protein